MSKARNLTKLLPDSSGLLPDANLAGLTASKLSGAVPVANGGTGATGGALGTGQTWQNVTASRSFGPNYVNTTGKPIVVTVWGQSGGVAGNKAVQIFTDGGASGINGFYTSTGNNYATITCVIPAGGNYSAGADGVALGGWVELR